MRNGTMALALFAAVILALGSSARADVVTAPPGLNPGDQYRLVFVTSTEIYGRSSAGGPTDISGYNAFATATATAVPELNALGTTWSAVVSTKTSPFVTAKTNTGTDPGVDGAGVPIYNLAGELVATGNADLWDGSIANAIDVNELGGGPVDQSSNGSGQYLVWTGATDAGNANNDWSLINPTGGWMYYGHADATDTTWVGDLGGENGWDANGNTNSQMPIYVMSGILTAASAGVPEPSTLALSTLGLLGLALYARRRRKR